MSKLINMEVPSAFQESFAFFGADNICKSNVSKERAHVTAIINAPRQFHIDELPKDELTEIVCDSSMDSLYSLLPGLARLSAEERWVTLIAPPANLDVKLFALYGIDLSRVLLIHPRDLGQATSVMNKALKNGKSGIVIYWSNLVPARFFAQWRKSAKLGSCTGVWVNLGGIASSSRSIALTANIQVTERYIRIRKEKEFGINNLENAEVVLPKIKIDNLLGLKQRYFKSQSWALN